MYNSKVIDGLELMVEEHTNQIYFSIQGLSKYISMPESTLRTKINKSKDNLKCFKPVGLAHGRRLIPSDLALMLVLGYKPECLTAIIQIIYSTTGVLPKLPDLSEVIDLDTIDQAIIKNTKAKAEGFIYVMEAQSSVIKVGFSTNIYLRLKSLSRWKGELTLIASISSSITQEQKLHKFLASTGIVFGYEWYPAARKNEILSVINKYKIHT